MTIQSIYTFNNQVPREGAKALPYLFKFSEAGTVDFNLLMEIQTAKISLVQGLYFSNFTGEDFEIECVGSGQRVKLESGKQGTAVLLCTNPAEFKLTSTGEAEILIHFLNFPTITSIT